MFKSKVLTALVLLLALAAMQVSSVKAAPLLDTLPDGTIVSVTQSTDASNNTIFVVVVHDTTGVDQTVNLTPAEAVAAGLVTDNGDGTFTVNDVIGKTITGGALFDACAGTDGANPVSAALTAFFCGSASPVLTPGQTIESLHASGFGFGEIAQACFMAEELGTTCGDLLTDKSNHDFSSLGLDGVTNWGQLRKYVAGQLIGGKLQSLGSIMSGRAAPLTVSPTNSITTTTTTTTTTHGHGQHGKGNGGGNGNGNGHKP
jgi:hypothetical protein